MLKQLIDTAVEAAVAGIGDRRIPISGKNLLCRPVKETAGRVAHISTVHPPEDTRIYLKECQTLARAGHDVHLIVGGPPPGHDNGVAFHSLSARWERPSLRRQWPLQVKALKLAWSLRAGVYHLHDPHLIPLGVALKLRGARVVYDVHEHYPHHARGKLFDRPGRGRIKSGVYTVLESLARLAFDGFVCVSDEVGARFPRDRTEVVHNYPIAEDWPEAVPYRDRPPHVVYLGLQREVRGLSEALDAVERVPASLECRLRLVGRVDPPAALVEAKDHPAWDRVDYLTWAPRPAALAELRRARVALVAFHPVLNQERPDGSNKLYEYMAAGLPVITSDAPAWRRLVEEVGCGLAVDPFDSAAIADAIGYLLANPGEAEQMGARGQAAVGSRFNWESEADRLLALYRRLE